MKIKHVINTNLNLGVGGDEIGLSLGREGTGNQEARDA